MRKAAVRHGDPTTTRGFVMALSSTIHDDNKKVALSGDEATCGNCKGTYKIFGTGQGMSEKGRCVVVDGDLVLCPCRKNRVIVGSNPGIFIETDNGSAVSGSSGAVRATSGPPPVAKVYDEQIRATGQGATVGYPYLIETARGRTRSGRVDLSALLPRITTDGFDEYTIYWGDDALAHRDWN